MEIKRYAPISSQIEEILLDRIQKRIYTTDKQFPSETELCQEFKVSRATIRTAISALTAKGLLVRRAGIGTFLTDSIRLDSGLEQLESVLSIAKRQGMKPTIGELAVTIISAEKQIAKRLKCGQNEPVLLIDRIILVGHKAVSHHQDFVPSHILSPEKIKEDFDGSVLDLLKIYHAPKLKEAVTEITSVNASERQGLLLGVQPGSALILLKETAYDEGGAPVSYSENFFVPDRFYLHVIRRKNFNQINGE